MGRRIAIYGKGGIGKSTTVSNVSQALAEFGLTVMQIGCDPKADSSVMLNGGRRIPTILQTQLERGSGFSLDDVVFLCSGVYCAECGGPKPGSGCAGRGIVAAFEHLERVGAFSTIKPDVVLYDVLGDVVCGGFAMPLRKGFAEEVYIVTSGEAMSLFAADNIVQAVNNNAKRGYARVKGLILNERGIADEQRIADEAAAKMGVSVVFSLPRSGEVQAAESEGATVVSHAPSSPLADRYRELARLMAGEFPDQAGSSKKLDLKRTGHDR